MIELGCEGNDGQLRVNESRLQPNDIMRRTSSAPYANYARMTIINGYHFCHVPGFE
jgi:hypothetical protein